jgi:hypothetical protein
LARDTDQDVLDRVRQVKESQHHCDQEPWQEGRADPAEEKRSEQAEAYKHLNAADCSGSHASPMTQHEGDDEEAGHHDFGDPKLPIVAACFHPQEIGHRMAHEGAKQMQQHERARHQTVGFRLANCGRNEPVNDAVECALHAGPLISEIWR